MNKEKTNNQGYPMDIIYNNIGTHMFNTCIGKYSQNPKISTLNVNHTPLGQRDRKK